MRCCLSQVFRSIIKHNKLNNKIHLGGGSTSVGGGGGCTDKQRGDWWRGEAARVLQASNGWAALTLAAGRSEQGRSRRHCRARPGKEETQICNDKREMKSLMEEGEFI